jgi:hypothetical protein
VPLPLRLTTAPAMLIADRQLETRCSHADVGSQAQMTDSSEASHRPGLTILMFRNIILRVGESTDKDKDHTIIPTCVHSLVPNRLMRAQPLHGRNRLVRVPELREEAPWVCGTCVSAPLHPVIPT